MIANDVARCTGHRCPSADNCKRYRDRILPRGVMAPFAALALLRRAEDALVGFDRASIQSAVLTEQINIEMEMMKEAA